MTKEDGRDKSLVEYNPFVWPLHITLSSYSYIENQNLFMALHYLIKIKSAVSAACEISNIFLFRSISAPSVVTYVADKSEFATVRFTSLETLASINRSSSSAILSLTAR